MFLGKKGVRLSLTKRNYKVAKEREPASAWKLLVGRAEVLPQAQSPHPYSSRSEDERCAQHQTTVEAARTRFTLWQPTRYFSARHLRHSLRDQLDLPPPTQELLRPHRWRAPLLGEAMLDPEQWLDLFVTYPLSSASKSGHSLRGETPSVYALIPKKTMTPNLTLRGRQTCK